MHQVYKSFPYARTMATIIGAGPCGLLAAWKLAEKGVPCHVYEEHAQVGNPVQCTGLLTSRISSIMKLHSEIILNRIREARIISGRTKLELPIDDLVIDRAAFDRHMAELAAGAGAELKLGRRVDSRFLQEIKRSDKDKVLIGADGPDSMVRKQLNPKVKVPYLVGRQAVVSGSFEPERFDVYIGEKVCPGFFAWCVPESNSTARVGLASAKDTAGLFNRFFKRLRKEHHGTELKVRAEQGGLIPLYTPKLCTEKDDTFLLGDAATQVKATTGGGLVPGMRAAHVLARCILDCKSYERSWRKAIGSELRTHLYIRNALDRFRDKDYEGLLEMLSQDRLRRLFREKTRDDSLGLALGILAREPRLLRFALKAL